MCEKKFPSTFKAWMIQQFTHNEMADISLYGAYQNYRGLNNYATTSALYDHYHTEIWKMLKGDYEAMGLNSCLEMISTFNHSDTIISDAEFKNLLVWYAAENIAFLVTLGEYDWQQDENDEVEKESEDDEGNDHD